MTTREALKIVAEKLTQELVVCTTGYTCRDMQALRDRPENFYMIGSMGLAASLGLGVALASPAKSVVVLDGDGSVLMGLGTLPMVAALKPKNLVHVVLDNEVFASTGNQRTYSAQVPLDALARACGYERVSCARDPGEVASQWQRLRQGGGPSFLLIKCRPDADSPKERIRSSPEEIAARFRKAVSE